MLKRFLLIVAIASLPVVIGYADQSHAKMTISVQKTSAVSGRQMYGGYCAPCHGVDGRGHGPVASALRAQPSDLTMLSRNNRGRFPDSHVAAVLQFGAEVQAHGSAEMPVWGPILAKMDQTNTQDTLLRISNLNRYLESMQAK